MAGRKKDKVTPKNSGVAISKEDFEVFHEEAQTLKSECESANMAHASHFKKEHVDGIGLNAEAYKIARKISRIKDDTKRVAMLAAFDQYREWLELDVVRQTSLDLNREDRDGAPLN